MPAIADWISWQFFVQNYLVLLFILLITVYLATAKFTRNLPPGPINLPIVGYTPFIIGKGLEDVFADLKKKYGDIVCINLGSQQVISLNSYDTIKEGLMLNLETAATRPTGFSTFAYMSDGIGIGVENGKDWQTQRRFLLSALRDLGLGKENLEYQIREEALILVKEFDKFKGQPFDPNSQFLCCASNIISSLMFGIRYKYNDPVFLNILNILRNSLKCLSPVNILNGFPILRFILPRSLSGIKHMDYTKEQVFQYVNKNIRDHEIRSNNDARDFTDIFLRQIQQDVNNGCHSSPLDKTRLMYMTFGLSIAGVTTTSTTLYWTIKMLIKYPEIQHKLHLEIDSVIGSGRVPSYSDRLNMPYMEAFLMELHRYANISAVGAPHAAKANTKISGYDIPAGATILIQIHLVHNDPKIWGDPENFRPERFIDCDGKAKKSDYLIQFGMGKRSCPGESLARLELFIFVTNLLQHFAFSAASAEDLTIQIEKNSITRDLIPFNVTAERRHTALNQHLQKTDSITNY